MSRFAFRTAALAALAFGVASTAAAAQSSPDAGAGGHYEWRTTPQFGPRTLQAQRRMWVPDNPRLFGSSCDMIRSPKTNVIAKSKGQSETPAVN